MLRGLVIPPAILVAFHPAARLPWNAGFPAPEQEAGMVAVATGFAVADGTMLVTTVVKSAEGLAMGPVNRLARTKESKLLIRAASRLWIHLPQA